MANSFLLLESLDFVLLEDGASKIILDEAVVGSATYPGYIGGGYF